MVAPSIVHRSAELHGRLELDWMVCCHHFSFGRFQDPARISWGLLRVLNHNVLKAGQQSPSQRHHNLETLFLVQAGTLLVRYGNDERLLVRTGQAAFVSAGFGVDLFLENPELWMPPIPRSPSCQTR